MQDNYEAIRAAVNTIGASWLTLRLAKYFAATKLTISDGIGVTTIHYWKNKGYVMDFKPARGQK